MEVIQFIFQFTPETLPYPPNPWPSREQPRSSKSKRAKRNEPRRKQQARQLKHGGIPAGVNPESVVLDKVLHKIAGSGSQNGSGAATADAEESFGGLEKASAALEKESNAGAHLTKQGSWEGR